jgi:hypothetical protein
MISANHCLNLARNRPANSLFNGHVFAVAAYPKVPASRLRNPLCGRTYYIDWQSNHPLPAQSWLCFVGQLQFVSNSDGTVNTEVYVPQENWAILPTPLELDNRWPRIQGLLVLQQPCLGVTVTFPEFGAVRCFFAKTIYMHGSLTDLVAGC